MDVCAKFEDIPSRLSWDIVFTRCVNVWTDNLKTKCPRLRLSLVQRHKNTEASSVPCGLSLKKQTKSFSEAAEETLMEEEVSDCCRQYRGQRFNHLNCFFWLRPKFPTVINKAPSYLSLLPIMETLCNYTGQKPNTNLNMDPVKFWWPDFLRIWAIFSSLHH